MTRRDYKLVARVIKKFSLSYPLNPKNGAKRLYEYFIKEFKEANGNFNLDKFKKACGL